LVGNIYNSYSTGSVAAGSNSSLGLLVGFSDPLGGVLINSAAVTSSTLKSELPSGFDPSVWGSDPTKNNGYPYLLWQFGASTPQPRTTFIPTIETAASTILALPPINKIIEDFTIANSTPATHGVPTLAEELASEALSTILETIACGAIPGCLEFAAKYAEEIAWIKINDYLWRKLVLPLTQNDMKKTREELIKEIVSELVSTVVGRFPALQL